MAQMCGHPGCGCLGEDGFCSDHCREHGEHADDPNHRCDCGHPDCYGQ